jgi:hypothetical protein
MAMAADFDDSELYERARDLLVSGKLPPGEPSGVWGGPGRGEQCRVCLSVVRPEEIGFDVSFRTRDTEIELHVHSRCRIAWERARLS